MHLKGAVISHTILTRLDMYVGQAQAGMSILRQLTLDYVAQNANITL
jgi:hypothetical protein